MVLGAFGAHALKARLSPDALSIWQTAVQYHFWHALAILAVALGGNGPWLKVSGWLFLAGVIVFSGSLYALALGASRSLGMLAPIGGAALILGWVMLTVAAIRG